MLAVDPSNGQSFKGVYVVRVAKNAFKTPEDVRACQNQVDKILGGGGRKMSISDAIRALFSKKSIGKVMTDSSGFIVDAQAKDGMHTFSVVSGAEKDEFTKQFSFSNLIAYMKENNFKNANEAANAMLKKIKSEFQAKPITEIEVDSLAELKEYAGKI